MRLTIPVGADLDVRLYALAKSLGCGKLDLAARLLDQGLRRYQSDARARSIAAEALEAAGAGEGRGDAAAV